MLEPRIANRVVFVGGIPATMAELDVACSFSSLVR